MSCLLLVACCLLLVACHIPIIIADNVLTLFSRIKNDKKMRQKSIVHNNVTCSVCPCVWRVLYVRVCCACVCVSAAVLASGSLCIMHIVHASTYRPSQPECLSNRQNSERNTLRNRNATVLQTSTVIFY